MTAVADPPRRVAKSPEFVPSPEDLVAKAHDGIYELIDGEAVEKPMGTISSIVSFCLGGLLFQYDPRRERGQYFGPDMGFQCWDDDPARVRKPDIAFVSRSRLPSKLPPGFFRIAPDLAVEVISPNDLASDVDRKIEECMAAGVSLIWVINPDTRTARVHRLDGSVARVAETGELDGEGVLPGFRCKLADVLPPKPDPQERRP